MFRKHFWLVIALSFFCAFVVPEKRAEAFIFRAAARVVGAAIGLAAGIAVGAARVVARTAVVAARTVRAVAVGAFRVGRFILFGRPYAAYYAGYYGRPYYYPTYYGGYSYYPRYYAYQPVMTYAPSSAHLDGWQNQQARAVDNSNLVDIIHYS